MILEELIMVRHAYGCSPRTEEKYLGASKNIKNPFVVSRDGNPVSNHTDLKLLKLQQRCTLLEEQLDQLEEIRNRFTDLDFDSLSPRKAFELLWELKEQKAI